MQKILLSLAVLAGSAAVSDQSFLAFDPGLSEGEERPTFIALMPVKGWKGSISRGSGSSHGGRAPSGYGELLHLALKNGISVVPIDPGDYIIDHMDFGKDPTDGEELPFPRRLVLFAKPGTVHYLGVHSLSGRGFSKGQKKEVTSSLCQQFPKILDTAKVELIRLQRNPVKVERPCDEESEDDT